MSRVRANLLLLFIAVIWASAFVFQSQGMAHMGPMQFTGIRFLVGAAVISPLMWMELRRLRLARQVSGQAGAPLNRRDWGRIAGLGSLLMLGAAMQQIGIVSTTVTNAGFLTALYVPLVPLLGWLLWRQLPHWSVWPAAIACVVGAFLLSGASTLQINQGDLWVIFSAFPWALHVLLVGRVADRMGAPFLVAGGQFTVCGLLALVWGLVSEPISLQGIESALIPILYTGVFSVGVAFTAQVIAQRHAQAADAAIILSSETLFAAFFGYLFMDERLAPAGLAGCSLILVSILAVQLIPMFQALNRSRLARS